MNTPELTTKFTRKPRTRAPRSRGSNALVEFSKSVVAVLRHNAAKEGLALRADGFARVDDLVCTFKFISMTADSLYLALRRLSGLTFASIKELVDKDDRQRFNLVLEQDAEQPNVTAWYIRANHGHTIQTVEVDMEEVTDAGCVPVAVHGTTRAAWPSNATQGLSPMGRQHIHMAQGVGGVGYPKNAAVLIFIDIQKVLDAGIKVLLSANGVVLTPGDETGFLRPEFISRVEDTRTGRTLGGFNGPRAPCENA